MTAFKLSESKQPIPSLRKIIFVFNHHVHESASFPVRQGNTEEELPERLLGTCRINHLDVSRAVLVRPWHAHFGSLEVVPFRTWIAPFSAFWRSKNSEREERCIGRPYCYWATQTWFKFWHAGSCNAVTTCSCKYFFHNQITFSFLPVFKQQKWENETFFLLLFVTFSIKNWAGSLSICMPSISHA